MVAAKKTYGPKKHAMAESGQEQAEERTTCRGGNAVDSAQRKKRERREVLTLFRICSSMSAKPSGTCFSKACTVTVLGLHGQRRPSSGTAMDGQGPRRARFDPPLTRQEVVVPKYQGTCYLQAPNMNVPLHIVYVGRYMITLGDRSGRVSRV